MPQTVEHLDILRLLNVPAGLIVLTKIDLVDEERLSWWEEDVRQAVQGTFSPTPLVRVSSITGDGLDALRAHPIASPCRCASAASPAPSACRSTALTMPGSAPSSPAPSSPAACASATRCSCCPMGETCVCARCSRMGAEKRWAGSRAALNLVGVELDEVRRGDVCATLVPSRPPNSWTRACNCCPVSTDRLPTARASGCTRARQSDRARCSPRRGGVGAGRLGIGAVSPG